MQNGADGWIDFGSWTIRVKEVTLLQRSKAKKGDSTFLFQYWVCLLDSSTTAPLLNFGLLWKKSSRTLFLSFYFHWQYLPISPFTFSSSGISLGATKNFTCLLSLLLGFRFVQSSAPFSLKPLFMDFLTIYTFSCFVILPKL